MVRCDYSIIRVADDRIELKDLNQGNRSVTNDAENVVEEITDKFGKDKRIFYLDSEGDWSELLYDHETGIFTGFGL